MYNSATHVYEGRDGVKYTGQWSRVYIDQFGVKSFGGMFYCHTDDEDGIVFDTMHKRDFKLLSIHDSEAA